VAAALPDTLTVQIKTMTDRRVCATHWMMDLHRFAFVCLIKGSRLLFQEEMRRCVALWHRVPCAAAQRGTRSCTPQHPGSVFSMRSSARRLQRKHFQHRCSKPRLLRCAYADRVCGDNYVLLLCEEAELATVLLREADEALADLSVSTDALAELGDHLRRTAIRQARQLVVTAWPQSGSKTKSVFTSRRSVWSHARPQKCPRCAPPCRSAARKARHTRGVCP